MNVRVNTNVQFQNLFIKCNTSEVSLYPLQEMVRFSLDVEPAYAEANKSYESMGSNHSLELKKNCYVLILQLSVKFIRLF